MAIKKHIPNSITLLNLLSGVLAVFFAIFGDLTTAGYLVVLGIVFDFFDGFAARILQVQGELGKQLDSLADMVTSGVVPGIVMFQLIATAVGVTDITTLFSVDGFQILPFLGLAIPLASAYRLAKFNIDTRQTSSFIGLPTPASTLVIVSLPWIIAYSSQDIFVQLLRNSYVLLGITALCSYLMNAEIPLFSLKFKNYTWKDNNYKFVFLIIALLLLVAVRYLAIPLVILLYVLISIWNNMRSVTK